MPIKLYPSQVSGSIAVPASKSAMQRACAAALLHPGATHIYNPGHCDDDMAARAMIEALGATVVDEGAFLRIQSRGVLPKSNQLHCGESGLGVRMFTPIAALSPLPLTITGSGSLTGRPLHLFDEILPQLGVRVVSQQGRLPLSIQGPLVPKEISIDGSLSSQFLTGLLMAFGAAATSPVTITVHDLKSRPYIDLTLELMRHFGYEVVHEQYERFVIHPRWDLSETTLTYAVEGDWSGAAFLLVAGAIAGAVTVTELRLDSAQADKAILQALIAAEARVSVTDTHIRIQGGELKAFQFDATDCPDLFPPLAALAAYCAGTSVITGVSRLAHKESNRALTLQEELGKMGVRIELQEDLMVIHGSQSLKGAIVHSRHDHRIAMACAVAALRADEPVYIEEPMAVRKSYPDFWTHWRNLGVVLEEV
jgi:3-phosphoshikimate 1-carboxyvinyltransferase